MKTKALLLLLLASTSSAHAYDLDGPLKCEGLSHGYITSRWNNAALGSQWSRIEAHPDGGHRTCGFFRHYGAHSFLYTDDTPGEFIAEWGGQFMVRDHKDDCIEFTIFINGAPIYEYTTVNCGEVDKFMTEYARKVLHLEPGDVIDLMARNLDSGSDMMIRSFSFSIHELDQRPQSGSCE